MMNEAAKQASRAIDAVSKAVANWTVSRIAEAVPDLLQRYGPKWRTDWLALIESQLALLSQAVAVRRPALFAQSATWTRAAFKARDVSETDLREGLRCLREVVETELPPPVAKVVVECVDEGLAALTGSTDDSETSHLDQSPQRKRVLQYLEAVLDGRGEDAHAVIFEAINAGLPLAEAYEHILQPAQIELGRLWHAGEISVADEHFGTATTESLMSMLRSRFPANHKNGRAVVATSVGGDLHAIGVRMVGDFFELDGWTTYFLGANTPASDIVEVLKARRGKLLAVSASTPLHLRDLGELIEHVRSDADVAATKILVGGLPFRAVPDLWQELGADGSAPSATDAVRVGNALVQEAD